MKAIRFGMWVSALASVVLPLCARAEPVDMAKRAEELKSLKWGMFICWSFSTFSGKEWTPGVKDVSFFKATGCDTDQWAPHGQGSRHGLHPVPDQAPRRLLPLGHEDHRPQGDQGAAGPRRAGRAAQELRQIRHQAGALFLRGRLDLARRRWMGRAAKAAAARTRR